MPRANQSLSIAVNVGVKLCVVCGVDRQKTFLEINVLPVTLLSISVSIQT